jgi:uncharacterized protein involved in exopolysaccharide biosynthesis
MIANALLVGLAGLAGLLAGIGTLTVARWAHERWRTRRDKGYSTRDTGAF